MTDHLLLVFSNAKPELEDAFNDWYSKIHVVDLVDKIDGIVAGQRFQVAGTYRDAAADYKYLAMYWIPDGKLEAAQEGLRWQHAERDEALAAGRTPMVPKFEEGFHGDVTALFYSSVTEKYLGSS
ncbi:MAG: hypothetical protein QOK15_1880 [Nocardioidaceae bacterium]|nr:hypothetical protein [Nocardioidaceae bacterium]